jgi:hypothetical protein
MEKDPYFKLLSSLPAPLPEKDLSGRIILTIEIIQEKRRRVELFAWGTVAAASLGGVVPSIVSTIRGFGSSGFTQYASLLFSDSGIVLSHWQSFLSSLSETFPVMEFTIVLATSFVFFWAVRKFVQTSAGKPMIALPTFAL